MTCRRGYNFATMKERKILAVDLATFFSMRREAERNGLSVAAYLRVVFRQPNKIKIGLTA